MKRILELSANEARDFLLKGKSYAGFDLPNYINFEDLITQVAAQIGNQNLTAISHSDPVTNRRLKPADYEEVNYKLLNNKDGKYAWRPFSLIHPALYVLLVKVITDATNWVALQARFAEFQANEKIVCLSLPVVSETEQSDVAEQVSAWWHEVEQGSIALGLEYEYVAHSDISDCYGSIYTHSIAWAVHSKANAKQERRNQNLLGNKIDSLIQAMSNGQTNGIPQGSTLMDFTAEIVLGYADLMLSEKLGEIAIDEYKILRYRDDYRIFVNSPQDAEAILKALTEILIDLGLRLNTQKTLVSDNIVRDSVKPEKRYWTTNGRMAKNIREHLQILHDFAEKFPNNGTLKKLLTEYYDRIKNLVGSPENVFAMANIVIDIAIKSPLTFPICSAILSKLISLLESNEEKIRVITSIQRKFDKIPNTGLLQLWLQRITLKAQVEAEYTERLCQKVTDATVTIWESEWLDPAIRAVIEAAPFFNQQIFDELGVVISADEVSLFVASSFSSS